MKRDELEVLIAGGGVAALEAALALRALAGKRVAVELVAPEPHFWYRPLSVAEPFALGKVLKLELAELAARAGATFTPGSLASVDARSRVARTSAGAELEYDVLLLALGAVPRPAIRGALTFRGPGDVLRMEEMLADVAAGNVHKIAFAVPAGAVWSLPIYELALLTSSWISARGIDGVELSLVTPEDAPLNLFGIEASEAVGALLRERGITVHARAFPVEARGGLLRLVPDGAVPADRVVALPRLHGPRIDGIPQTIEGFVPIDASGRVPGLPGVYAAGDITTFPVKQGGIATQQADAAAEAIAASAGADVEARPFRPVLRGLLLTGGEPRYLRHDITGGAGESTFVEPEPLWWPPAKIVGRYLGPFLAARAGGDAADTPLPRPGAVPVRVELDPAERRDLLIEAAVGDALERAGLESVGDVMADPIVVAPEDTLGEVAERMRERDVGSALVADHGRLIGILTSRDLLRAFAGRVHPSEGRVREWMTAEPLAVPAATTLDAAALLMSEHGIHHLPVVAGDRPVGMVGMRDVLRRSAAPLEKIGLGL